MLVSGEIIADYRVVELQAVNNSCHAYLVSHPKLGDARMLQIEPTLYPDFEALEALIQRTHAQLGRAYPGLCTLLEAQVTEDQVFCVYQPPLGLPLCDFYSIIFAARDTLNLVHKAARALVAPHGDGETHGNISSSTFFLDDQQISLADFALPAILKGDYLSPGRRPRTPQALPGHLALLSLLQERPADRPSSRQLVQELERYLAMAELDQLVAPDDDLQPIESEELFQYIQEKQEARQASRLAARLKTKVADSAARLKAQIARPQDTRGSRQEFKEMVPAAPQTGPHPSVPGNNAASAAAQTSPAGAENRTETGLPQTTPQTEECKIPAQGDRKVATAQQPQCEVHPWRSIAGLCLVAAVLFASFMLVQTTGYSKNAVLQPHLPLPETAPPTAPAPQTVGETRDVSREAPALSASVAARSGLELPSGKQELAVAAPQAPPPPHKPAASASNRPLTATSTPPPAKPAAAMGIPAQAAVLPLDNQSVAATKTAIPEQPAKVDRRHADPLRDNDEPLTTAGQADLYSEAEAFLGLWAAAWSDQAVDAYLSYYAPNFALPNYLSRSAWEAQRRQRLSRPFAIQVDLAGLVVRNSTGPLLRIEFLQNYRSNLYSDRTVKLLDLTPLCRGVANLA